MAQQIIQQLTVYLKGGQTVVVPFNAEKAEVLNPQIEAFVKALGDATKKDGSFLFQGARVVLLRLSEVAGAEVVSLVRKEKEEAAKLIPEIAPLQLNGPPGASFFGGRAHVQEVIGLWPTLIPRDALRLTTHILEVK